MVCLGPRERDAVPAIAGTDGGVFLGVAAGELAAAIEVLKKGGFRFLPSGR